MAQLATGSICQTLPSVPPARCGTHAAPSRQTTQRAPATLCFPARPSGSLGVSRFTNGLCVRIDDPYADLVREIQ
ncbi:hypothetical protein GCM10023074_49450 [Microbispora amethystogenes]|uniref:Uncharacterized protein n=1 Tax=Microbispora amethystogenes TaxID=1427754 RepID=A0ABQ4FG83_9ACTN|nr:hypothetical protein Mam01_39910 [Microbispora amethystogenes]